jgi:hypothetical protein
VTVALARAPRKSSGANGGASKAAVRNQMPEGKRISRREVLKLCGLGAAAAFLPTARTAPARSSPGISQLAGYHWLNQTKGPRPPFVWENCEDLVYHDIEYGDPALDGAPEFCAFMRRVWVFNRAMRWQRGGLDGAIVCYSAAKDLELTGTRQASAWHSDPENEISASGKAMCFVKKSTRRCRDAAVLPAFQFHLGQHPTLEVIVHEADAEWQFVVSVKGRSGPPLVSSGWRRGPDVWRVDLAAELRRRGYHNNFAELHFVIGSWNTEAAIESAVMFEARLLGQPAVVGCLPVICTEQSAAQRGAPVAALVTNELGQLLGASAVRVQAEVLGRRLALTEERRCWRGVIRGLKPGDYSARLVSEGQVAGATTISLRVTDGHFDRYDRALNQVIRNGQPTGPLTGSYQGTFLFRDVGAAAIRLPERPKTTPSRRTSVMAPTPLRAAPNERLVNGQAAWDAWSRAGPIGEHQHYWEALTESELEQRFAYLAKCGWDLVHLHQHWGVWERLDAGGRIAPHGAEQLALYLRVADRHGLKLVQALTSYEYSLHRTGKTFGGTAPFSRYVDAGFQDRDFFEPANRPFDEFFRQYLKDFASLFREETALFAVSASGEGDHFIGLPRARAIHATVRSLDTNHLFVSEPVHILDKLPSEYTADWPQDLWGARTYAIGQELLPEFDLGVEFKFYQLGRLYQAEGSFAAAPHYVRFQQALKGTAGPESWTGAERYRTRLRDSLYLGLVHRLPVIMSWDEQVAEDEHLVLRQARQRVDWRQPWLPAPIAVRVDNACVRGEGRARLADYERLFVQRGLAAQYVSSGQPVPAALFSIDARQPYAELRFASAGGPMPDALKALIPVSVAGVYCVSWCWSADRRTLLAYLYNTADHLDLQGSHDLSGRYHRLPRPATLRFRLQSLPDVKLAYWLYDLNTKQVTRSGTVRQARQFDLDQTDHDFLLVVCPETRS